MKKILSLFTLLLALTLLSSCGLNEPMKVEKPEDATSEDVNKPIDKNPDVEDERNFEEIAYQEQMNRIRQMYPNIKSATDFNENEIDDYSDFVNGARKDAINHPIYDPAYVGTNKGYPAPERGVCTDVIWRAFKEAGYSIRSMLNNDIENDPGSYTLYGPFDGYIEFRRVNSMRPFLEKYFKVLPNELEDPNDWQPGDIVIFNPDDYHIGLLSDNRNLDGFPLVFHNQGQSEREEDFLSKREISGHFRFVPEDIPQGVLVPWEDGEDGQ